MSENNTNQNGGESRWNQARNEPDSSTPWGYPTEAEPTQDSRPPMPSVPPMPTPPAAASTPEPPAPPADLPIYGTPKPPAVSVPNALRLDPQPASAFPDASAPPVPSTQSGIAVPPTPGVPGAPVSPPLLSGTYGSQEPIAPAAGGGGNGRLGWIVAVVGALALLLGGGFFALSALGASGGGKTPEEAVDKMIAAINEEDLLAMGEMVEPGERRTLIDPTVDDIMPELQRLGVFSDDLDMGSVDGIDFELTGVEYRVETIPGHDDLVHVFFTSGQSTASFTADDFPFGDAILSRFGDDLEDQPAETELIEESTPIVLVERDDRWFFSMWYTVGENARIEFDTDLPTFAEQPAALGTGSPEEAIEQFIAQAVDFDLRSMIGTLDPEEAAALYRYSPLFLDEAQGSLDEAKRTLIREGVEWEVTDMDFDVDTDGDDAVVTIRGFTFRASGDDFETEFVWARDAISFEFSMEARDVTINASLRLTPDAWTFDGQLDEETLSFDVDIDRDARALALTGDFSGDPFTGSFALDDQGVCSRYTFQGLDVDESGCLEDGIEEEAGARADLVVDTVADWFDQLPEDFTGPSVAAHETNGEWYVSPTGTVMQSVIDGLQNLDQETFDDFLDGIESDEPGLDPFSLLFGGFNAAEAFAMGPPADFVPFPDGGITDEPIFDEPFDPFGEELEFTLESGPGQTTLSRQIESPNEVHVYNLELTAGQVVGITVEGGAVVPNGMPDPELTLTDYNGEFLAYNDDFVGLNSGLQYEAFASGNHRIEVRELGGGTGGYMLTVEVVRAGQTPSVASGSGDLPDEVFDTPDPFVEDIEEITVVPGTPTIIENNLPLAAYDVWNVVGVEPGQTFTVSLTSQSPDFDPFISVVDGTTFRTVIENDDAFGVDGLGPLDSYVEFRSDSGSYYIEAHTLGDTGSGDYTLTIELG